MPMKQKRTRTSSKQYLATSCRICRGNKLYKFLDLGSMPIPNGFLTKEDLKLPEPKYPLGAAVCEDCSLVQLTHVLPAEIMFKNYLYIPSTAKTMLDHFQTMANEVIEEYHLTSKDLVIDIGSNDGTLLGYFKEQEVRVLGIDPASNLVQVARLRGIDTIDDFFTPEVGRQVAKDYGKAKIVCGTNVFAHIDDIHGVCEGAKAMLDEDGVFIGEFPYLADLIEKNEFDTIYHEHLSYFAIRPLVELFKQHGMHIINIKRTPVHGGSIMVFAANKKSKYKQSPVVQEFIQGELLRQLDKKATYDEFARRVRVIKRDLLGLLKRLRTQGKTIVGYGASAKCNVLLNYCGISTDLLDYIVDSIPYKQGRFTPGTHVPIHPESRLEKDHPDYALLTAWNFAEEILRKQIKFRERGGQFIITIPYLRIE